MPTGTLHITGDADADRLLNTDPLALLHRHDARPAGAHGVGVQGSRVC